MNPKLLSSEFAGVRWYAQTWRNLNVFTHSPSVPKKKRFRTFLCSYNNINVYDQWNKHYLLNCKCSRILNFLNLRLKQWTFLAVSETGSAARERKHHGYLSYPNSEARNVTMWLLARWITIRLCSQLCNSIYSVPIFPGDRIACLVSFVDRMMMTEA